MKKQHLFPIFAIGLLTTVVGVLFRITHWPFGRQIYWTGLAILILSFVLTYFKNNNRP